MNRYAAAMYRASPIWCQNLLLTAYSSLLERERYGGQYPGFRDLLQRTEWASRAELEVSQDDRLRAIVSHAYETVPFYRRRFDACRLKPTDIRGRSDLPKLPLLTRGDIRGHFKELRS